jgi:uncharacterized membrane protein YsdA (DUF1294 family)
VIAQALVISLPWHIWAYLAMSMVTFIVYAVDKSRARRGGRRVPENVLHLLEFAFGWPGALIAQGVVKHKRRKTSFMIVFWIIVAVHLAFWVWKLGWIRF